MNIAMNQSNTPVSTIIFDFGGVLMDWNPRYLYRKLFNDDTCAMENFLAETDFAGWNVQQDRGRPFAAGVAELSEQFPQYAGMIRAYDERWEESIAGPIQPTVDIVHELRQAGYRLHGLSNWSDEKFQIARAKYEFFGWFDTILVSGSVGLLKPDPRIYVLFLERIRRVAAECLFIDDSEANVAGARQIGFETIRYVSSDQLRTELGELDLLPQNKDRAGQRAA
jgi:2-haloacid dehalogenase